MKRKTIAAGYRGYIPVYLNDEAKANIKREMFTLEGTWLHIEEYVEDGYKFTLGWDEYNTCLSASLFDTNPQRATGGYILSAKHIDLLTVLNTLIYLHEQVYPDGWDIERADKSNPVNW